MMTRVCDVTIRESEQLPGRSYDLEAKLEAGRVLDELGVPYIQAGFPVVGETEQSAVRELAETVDADVVAIARATEHDVEAALEANADVIELFGPLSDRHLTATVKTDRDTMYDRFRQAIDRATAGGAEVHLTLMDAFRTEIDYLRTACDRFDDVRYLGLADTVGATPPPAVEDVLNTLETDGIAPDRLGVHFHDDLGVATANAITAAAHGVGRLDVSVASFGERAGNPSLEEVAILCDRYGYADLELRNEELIPLCERVLDTLDEAVDERKAVLGADVFEHESGLHTAAMLRDPSTFEPFDPSTYGGRRTLMFGSGTGAGAARQLLSEADLDPTTARVDALLSVLDREGPVSLEAATDLARDLE
jgi:isopropylmalate/homocitrate/citramalate synthase